jgi:hypothetical protein
MSLLDKLKGVFSKKESETKYTPKSGTEYNNKSKPMSYENVTKISDKYISSSEKEEISDRYKEKSEPKNYVNKTTEIKDSLEKVAETETQEKAPAAALAIVGILGGIYTLSPNLTGNAVSDMGLTTTNIFGVIILILGFVGLYLLFRKKKKVPQKQIVVSKKRAVSRKKKKRR